MLLLESIHAPTRGSNRLRVTRKKMMVMVKQQQNPENIFLDQEKSSEKLSKAFQKISPCPRFTKLATLLFTDTPLDPSPSRLRKLESPSQQHPLGENMMCSILWRKSIQVIISTMRCSILDPTRDPSHPIDHIHST